MLKRCVFFWFLSIAAKPLRDPFAPCIRQEYSCKALGKVAGTEKRFALLASRNKEQIVALGDIIDGYEVIRITDRELALKNTRDSELKIVFLEGEGKKSPST
jgi:hypothetical protein